MKFKYKKIIILITMCTMCIGVVTISLTTPKEKQTRQTVENNRENNTKVQKENTSSGKNQEAANIDKKDAKTVLLPNRSSMAARISSSVLPGQPLPSSALAVWPVVRLCK